MKGIMIQGTASDVGKSYVTTAICRILSDAGYKVAPFKSQNMSNNSYVTDVGGEIGRAQGVQAEAARVNPSVYMNPILLKPQKDTESEIVLLGKVYRSSDGFAYRKDFAMTKGIETIKESLKYIEDHYDCIVIEGAGSPAEVNLNDREIVNMRVAELADVDVVLVVDIDRGGSFASIVGTLELVFEHRHRIQGLVFNKFRGDIKLLEDGLKWVEEYTGIPVLGVIPYMKDIHIEVEDAQSMQLLHQFETDEPLDIGVIHLERVSNNTDVEPFIHEQDVSIRIISRKEHFGKPHALIIPGTKSTMGDLLELKDKGLIERIKNYHEAGGLIFGICGGYQILGEKIYDPKNIDQKELYELDGIGLLPVETVFNDTKQVRKIGGVEQTTNKWVNGYEIHLGETKILNDAPFMTILEDWKTDGCMTEDKRVRGTYLHHIFHNDEFRNAWLNEVRTYHNLPTRDVVDTKEIKEKSYDLLANRVKENIDMDLLFKIVEGFDDDLSD